MNFGRLSSLEGVDFTIPPDPPSNLRLLEQGRGKPAQIYLGCPLWADRGFVGKIYPPKTPQNKFLYFYARQFNAIELNATLYNVPKLETLEAWKSSVPESFRFCPKFSQSVSHRNDLGMESGALERFLERIETLRPNLGPVFLQLSESFSTKKRDLLYRFLDKLPKTDWKFCVEVRHESWFHDESLFEVLAGHGVGAVVTDTAGRRDVLHMRLTARTTFVRFTGNDLHPTDYTRLDAWVDVLDRWQNLEEIYFFVHTPTKHLTADMSIYLVEKLKARGFQLEPPQTLDMFS